MPTPPRPVVLLSCAVLALTTTGLAVTRATWTATRPLGTPALRTGSLVLLAGPDAAPSHAAPLSWSAASLAPGGWAQAPVRLVDGGSAPLSWRLQGWTAGSAPLRAVLDLTATSVPSSTSCPASTGTSGTAPGTPVDLTQPRTLAAGASEVVCLRVALPAGAPQSVAGTSTQLVLTFRADQA